MPLFQISLFFVPIQAVRSKRSYKSGIHKWHIRELPFYSPNLEMEEDIQCSGIHIGVGTLCYYSIYMDIYSTYIL